MNSSHCKVTEIQTSKNICAIFLWKLESTETAIRRSPTLIAGRRIEVLKWLRFLVGDVQSVQPFDSWMSSNLST